MIGIVLQKKGDKEGCSDNKTRKKEEFSFCITQYKKGEC